jgi:hypothetical protein
VVPEGTSSGRAHAQGAAHRRPARAGQGAGQPEGRPEAARVLLDQHEPQTPTSTGTSTSSPRRCARSSTRRAKGESFPPGATETAQRRGACAWQESNLPANRHLSAHEVCTGVCTARSSNGGTEWELSSLARGRSPSRDSLTVRPRRAPTCPLLAQTYLSKSSSNSS